MSNTKHNNNEEFNRRVYSLSSRIDHAVEKKYGKPLSDAELITRIKKHTGYAPGPSTLSKIRNAKTNHDNPNPTIRSLLSIADTLGITLDYLLSREDKYTEVASEESIDDTLGLSIKATKTLRKLKAESDAFHAKQERGTSTQKTRSEKQLIMINWILEHIGTNICKDSEDDIDDFLLILYALVMNDFSRFKGNMLDIFFDYIRQNTFDALNTYKHSTSEKEDAVIRYNNTVGSMATDNDADEKKVLCHGLFTDIQKKEKNLMKSRAMFVLNEPYNIRNREIIDLYFNKGIIPVIDPLTDEEIKYKIPAPTAVLKDRLDSILNEWHAEYKKKYDSEISKKKKADMNEAKKAFATIHNTDVNQLDNDNENDSYIPSERLYRDPCTYFFSEDEMKLYLLYKYIDDNTNLGQISFAKDGSICFSNAEAEDIENVIASASERGIGLYLDDDNMIRYDPGKATPPDSRLKIYFERELIPYYYKQWLNDKMPLERSYKRIWNYQVIKYTEEELSQIISEAKAAGAKYELNETSVNIFRTKRQPQDNESFKREEAILSALEEGKVPFDGD